MELSVSHRRVVVGRRGVESVFVYRACHPSMTRSPRDALLNNIVLGRLDRSEKIASAVAFLTSPGASYITGSTLHVNGGMYMS